MAEAETRPIEWLNMLKVTLNPHSLKLSVLLAIFEVGAFVAMVLFIVAYVVAVFRSPANRDDYLLSPVERRRKLEDSNIARPSGSYKQQHRRGTIIGGEGMSEAQESHLYGGPLRYRGGPDARNSSDKMTALEKMHHGMIFNPEQYSPNVPDLGMVD